MNDNQTQLCEELHAQQDQGTWPLKHSQWVASSRFTPTGGDFIYEPVNKTNVSEQKQNAVGTWHGLRPPEYVRYFHVPRLNRIDVGLTVHLSRARGLLAEYEELAPNWDSYGAAAISRRAVGEANQLLDRIAESFGQPGLPETIVPVPDGGIQFEWDKPAASLEVEIQDDGKVGALILRPGHPTETRDDLTWPLLRELLGAVVD